MITENATLSALPIDHSRHLSRHKDENRRHADWEDLFPLTEGLSRPIEWTSTSLIFIAHPDLPQIICVHFPSSIRINIPNPEPLSASVLSYSPPSIISASFEGNLVFAFFPGKAGDGICCIWQRGMKIDDWNIKDWWSVARAAAVVEVGWLCQNRKWSFTSTGLATRLLPRGPYIPLSNSILFVLSENYDLLLCYLQPQNDTLRKYRHSLHAAEGKGDASVSETESQDSSSIKRCTHATIGFSFNEKSILIAMHSQHISLPKTSVSTLNLDGLDLASEDRAFLSSIANDNEFKLPESKFCLEIYVLELTVDGFNLNISSKAVLTRPWFLGSTTFLSDIMFLNVPPGPPLGSKMEGKNPASHTSSGELYLLTSSINFNDYSHQPSSTLTVHSCRRGSSNSAPEEGSWIFRQENSRSLHTGLIIRFNRTAGRSCADSTSVVVNLLELKENSHAERDNLGSPCILDIKTLTLGNRQNMSSDISDIDTTVLWLSTLGISSLHDVIYCSAISNLMNDTRVKVHLSPTLTNPPSQDEMSGEDNMQHQLSERLTAAILSGENSSDVGYVVASPARNLQQIEVVLARTSKIIVNNGTGLNSRHLARLIGAAMDMYRYKLVNVQTSSERDLLKSRLHAGQDLCFLLASPLAWESCTEGDSYDLDSIWQLISLSRWFMEYLSQIFCEAVHCMSVMNANDLSGFTYMKMPKSNPSINTSETSAHNAFSLSDSIYLLCLDHVLTLKSLLSNIKYIRQIRVFVGALAPQSQNAKLAKESLVDIIDKSGIDLGSLERCLQKNVFPMIQKNGSLESLAPLHASPDTCSRLKEVLPLLLQKDIVDKRLIFSKTYDDPSNTIQSPTAKSITSCSNGVDMILKKNLEQPCIKCLQCSGRSSILMHRQHVGSVRWKQWERTWNAHCVCGGMWLGQ